MQRECYGDMVRRDHAVVVSLAEQVATADEMVRQLAEQLVGKDNQIHQLQAQVRALILAKACDLSPDDVSDLPDPDVVRDVEAQGVHKLSRTDLVALVRKKEQTIRALVQKVAETRAERGRFPAHGASPSPPSPPLDLIYLLPDPTVAERKILDREPPTTAPDPPAASPTRTIPADIPASGIAPRALTRLRAEYTALYTERDELAAALAAVREEVATERREHAAQVAELRAAVRRLKEFLWPGDLGET
ncbi:hypothetical protein GGF32_004716 [Allomyces javanicus]|nr:hypothetical protein GGF32_004716 [Allomyces javanicus]